MKIPKDVRKRIASLYSKRVPTRELCQRFGVSSWAVRQVAREYDVPINPRGQMYRAFSKQEIARMVRMSNAGKSQTAIAEAFGSHQVIVSRVMRAAGHRIERRIARGESHGSWKGGRTVSGEGYALVKVDRDDPLFPMAGRIGYVLEHRLVMARHIGRPLLKNETVHHINGKRADNRIENLQLRQGRHGKGVRMVCCDCGSANVKPATLC